MFDELYNDAAKKNQMELHIRYWDFQKNVLATRSYGFDFLRKSSAKDILHSSKTCLEAPQKERMIQISSDRPNMNLLIFDMIKGGKLPEIITKFN